MQLSQAGIESHSGYLYEYTMISKGNKLWLFLAAETFNPFMSLEGIYC
jgi:hypothetical protein